MNSETSSKVGPASGRPGIPPRWSSSSKEGVGTAYSTANRAWFTLSHGILNEVYFPIIDRPQIRDLQFLITDGATFFHEEALEPALRNALETRMVGPTLGSATPDDALSLALKRLPLGGPMPKRYSGGVDGM